MVLLLGPLSQHQYIRTEPRTQRILLTRFRTEGGGGGEWYIRSSTVDYSEPDRPRRRSTRVQSAFTRRKRGPNRVTM